MPVVKLTFINIVFSSLWSPKQDEGNLMLHFDSSHVADVNTMKERDMKKRFSGRLTALVILTSCTAIAIAQDSGQSDGEHKAQHGKGMHHDGMGRGRGGGYRDPARMIEMMQRHLDLDDLQTQQLNNIMGAVKPEFQAAHAALSENREAMRSLQTNDPDYDAKLQNLSSANAELAATMTLLHGRVRAEVFAVLTPEQTEMIEERRQRMRDSGHRRGHRDAEEQAENLPQ
jgi:Spy/CpxP family protein refolding chaperone